MLLFLASVWMVKSSCVIGILLNNVPCIKCMLDVCNHLVKIGRRTRTHDGNIPQIVWNVPQEVRRNGIFHEQCECVCSLAYNIKRGLIFNSGAYICGV